MPKAKGTVQIDHTGSVATRTSLENALNAIMAQGAVAWTILLDSPSNVVWSGDAICDATVNRLRYLHRNVITQQLFDERVTQCTIYGKGV